MPSLSVTVTVISWNPGDRLVVVSSACPRESAVVSPRGPSMLDSHPTVNALTAVSMSSTRAVRVTDSASVMMVPSGGPVSIK